MFLEVINVDVYYGAIRAITGVSLKMEKGETVAILGRNGAGKTTILKTIAGFLKPSAGVIKFNGQDITRLPPHKVAKLGIRYIAQDKRVFSRLTVKENLELAAYASNDWDINHILDIFPRLKKLLNNKAAGLSGGERQMLLIARGLIGKPSLILMDEPTEGLAAYVITELFDALKLLKSEGISLLLVEQNLPVASMISDRIYIMKDGGIVKEIIEEKEIKSMSYEKLL